MKTSTAIGVSVTSSGDIGSRACSRVFEGGYTFRLAKGDTGIAVFVGTCVEQRRFLVIRETRFPTPPVEGPQQPLCVLPKPFALDWSDHAGLRAYARVCLGRVRDRHRGSKNR
ncbi:hypothetical protein DFQ13_102752 [Actinokineospora spheciospongiae]|nr:hypothetical protein DFQ13_102752 [Actinokineospora spheciospongiae]